MFVDKILKTIIFSVIVLVYTGCLDSQKEENNTVNSEPTKTEETFKFIKNKFKEYGYAPWHSNYKQEKIKFIKLNNNCSYKLTTTLYQNGNYDYHGMEFNLKDFNSNKSEVYDKNYQGTVGLWFKCTDGIECVNLDNQANGYKGKTNNFSFLMSHHSQAIKIKKAFNYLIDECQEKELY